MDPLVLIRMTADLDAQLRGAIFRDLREQGRHRLRLLFERDGSPRSAVLSLRPERPWLARPTRRSRRDRPRRPAPFSQAVVRALKGALVERVELPGPDREVRIRFSDGHGLVIELTPHGGNVILLDRDCLVAASARMPRSARARLRPGEPFASRPLPPGRLVPVGRSIEEIDRFLEEKVRGGEPALEALRRHVLGIGTPGARLILLESAASGASPGRVLHTRLGRLRDGLDEPVLEGRGDPSGWDDAGAKASDLELWPWEPPGAPAAGRTRHRDAGGPAATAGKFHEALDADEEHREHREELVAIVRREQRRTDDVLRKVARDLRAFEKPERHRRWGEALLAGLSVARRREDHAVVPDPYDFSGALIEVPAPAGVPLAGVAEEHFRRHRRALRGLEAAERRARAVRRRAGALAGIRDSLETAEQEDHLVRIEAELRGLGIPVGLDSGASRATAPDRRSRARLAGVRLFVSSDGVEILAGRSGRHNDRLTFRVAGPEDFWFHALNWPGAHVVARNPDRRTRPPEATLREAAAIAAWFSEGREQDRLDVQWTRRKYVRRIRGAARGRVRIKRFETVRVRPGLPAGQADSL